MDELLRALTAGAGRPQDAQENPLGNLLSGLAGSLAGQQPAAGENPLAGLLAALAGAQKPAAETVSDLAAEAQVSPAVVQAVIALLVGQLAGQQPTKTGSIDLNDLLTPADSSGEVDEVALRASGLPQALVGTAGLDLASAIRVLQKLLPALASLLGLPGAKPATSSTRPKPATSTAKPKPAAATAKPTASTAKPKPATSTARPKPATSTAKPKPTAATGKPSASTTRPKPAASTAKPTTRPRPRKSERIEGIDLGETPHDE